MKKLISLLRKDERGASLIEYVLLAALIGVAALIGMGMVGTQANTTLTTTAGQMAGGGGAAPPAG